MESSTTDSSTSNAEKQIGLDQKKYLFNLIFLKFGKQRLYHIILSTLIKNFNVSNDQLEKEAIKYFAMTAILNWPVRLRGPVDRHRIDHPTQKCAEISSK